MKWKNKLKMVLAETAKPEKTEMCLENALTKAAKTPTDLVSSVFVSNELAYFPENCRKAVNSPECSNCGLELETWKGELFCAMGCGYSAKHKLEKRYYPQK